MSLKYEPASEQVIPAGSHRWDIQKPTTKQSNVRYRPLTRVYRGTSLIRNTPPP